MPRGRPVNPLRAAAREAGEKTYVERDPCLICGTNLRYTVSTGCVKCVTDRSKTRYAGLDEAAKAAHKLRDQERHMSAKLGGRQKVKTPRVKMPRVDPDRDPELDNYKSIFDESEDL